MRFKLALAMIAGLVAAPALADEVVGPGRGTYASIFGGGGFASDTGVAQLGTAFFIEAQGGPLAVNARGTAGSGGVGFIGGQIGHEWSNGTLVLPAVELEGFFISNGSRHASLNSPTDRLDEHSFDDTFSQNTSVFLANLVFSLPTTYYGLTPYLGGGIGAARVGVSGANSLQIAPPEAGVNHFNSDPELLRLHLRGTIKGRRSHGAWPQRLRVRGVSLPVRRLRRSDTWVHCVPQPRCDLALDTHARRLVLLAGNRRHRN